MSTLTKLTCLVTLTLGLSSPVSFASDEDMPIGAVVERHLSLDQPVSEWVQDPDRVDEELGDTIELREKEVDALETIKLANLVPPVHFQTGVADIPDTTVAQLADILERMDDRLNVRLHLIGHADNQPLSPRLEAIYGDNAGLSRERAGQVAEHFQNALSLPPEGISYEWAGDTQPVASNSSPEGRAMNRRVEVEVWYDEVAKKVALEEILVPHEIRQVKVCRMETVCKLRYVEGHAKRARVQNLVAPIRFDEEAINVSDVFIENVSQAMTNLKGKDNVVVKFVGYSDDAPLTGRAERIYGDAVGLSKARARRVALAVQDELDLSSFMVESDGRGAERPLGNNATAQGRALNRRVEVEFWYDDPLQDLPDEPQLCPEDIGAQFVTRIYNAPWGDLQDISFADGEPVIPENYTATLQRALADVADKTKPRLRFVGFTSNERLERRTASVYGDDIGLSASRARRTMEVIAESMQLEPGEVEFEGRGYVHSDDVVNSGFVQGDSSHVTVQVVYDELAILDDYEGVDITRITRELEPKNPLGLNLMRITVDGIPIDDPKRSSADIQRCTDVAFANVDIQFGYDNLRSAPRLSVAAKPSSTTIVRELQPERPIYGGSYRLPDQDRASPIHFRMYTNYSSFIERAEVRVFGPGQSPQAKPLDVVAIDLEDTATWAPDADSIIAQSDDQLTYVLRAYGEDGNFDETQPQPLWVLYDQAESIEAEEFEQTWPDPDPELLQAYGEDRLSLHNIGLSSGTVNVRGTGVPEDHEVWVAGRPIPVDETGSFVSEEILPNGAHTVEVSVLDAEGSGELYLRDLELEENDWFYVGMANLTVAENSVNGPAELLQGENGDDDLESDLDGRLAFFVNGKFGEHWKLTAGADTREGPVDTLFSNFMEKSPTALFRRIDPDYFYPTFGDDSTVEEMAPSMGKFYVRLANGDDYGQWGNFKIGYMNNELAHVDRGLYGANFHFESDGATEFGEKKLVADVFAAEPGTVGTRDEFRGTGGSLYFLQRQDILAGSERVRIEIRDKSSGMVTGVVNLMPSLDYDIDYLQGRILLTEPLASSVDDSLLVRSNAISGDEAHLVVRYEYTPGFGEIDAVATGGQASYWFGEHVKLGVTSNINEQNDADSTMNGADLTLRWSAGSWLKVQQAESEGLVAMPVMSDDGGFEFNSYDPAAFVDAEATANRADISVNLGDFFQFTDARFNVYMQEVEAGYSAPGLTALTDTENVGGSLMIPFGSSFSLQAKADSITQDQGIEMDTQEYNLGYSINQNWDVSAGYRRDERLATSVIVPLTQEQGARADAVLQIGYNSRSTWDAYAFAQDTLSVDGDRQENSRAGFGGSYRMSEKLRIEGEVSDGDLGVGGRIGTNYMHSEKTSMYVNYALENERTDNAMRSTRGGGNLIAGVKSRLSDSTSVYLEERYQHSTTMTGLTHATGINFAGDNGWSFGLNSDIGTLEDVGTGAETERLALGLQLGFGSDALQFSSAVEYRDDDVQQIDLSNNQRETWLYKNSFKYQMSEGGRLLGKLNHSDSTSSQGSFFDGGFTEAVLGYAYRPVTHDRLNTLVKYTYFFNMPTTDQVGSQNVSLDFLQKSHIAALDVTYDLTQNFTIGGKYAHRLSQISLDREDPEFFDNNASLYVLRGDYRFRKNWELLLEARLLDMADLNESRTGALTTISRYFGDHFKLGIGYNFADFSDDLTDLSYDHSGAFLSITGSL